MNDLAAWLLEQIDYDDPRNARRTEHSGVRYRELHDMDCPAMRTGAQECTCDGYDIRVAECEAKRRIVAQCRDWLVDPGDDYGAMAVARDVLLHLALPYADRDDYRDEWRSWPVVVS